MGNAVNHAELLSLRAGGPTEKIEQLLISAVGGVFNLLSGGNSMAIPFRRGVIEIGPDHRTGDNHEQCYCDQIEEAFEPFHGITW